MISGILRFVTVMTASLGLLLLQVMDLEMLQQPSFKQFSSYSVFAAAQEKQPEAGEGEEEEDKFPCPFSCPWCEKEKVKDEDCSQFPCNGQYDCPKDTRPDWEKERDRETSGDADQLKKIDEARKQMQVKFLDDIGSAKGIAREGKVKKAICIYFHDEKDSEYPQFLYVKSIKELENKEVVFVKIPEDMKNPSKLLTSVFVVRKLPAIVMTDWLGNKLYSMEGRINPAYIEKYARLVEREHESLKEDVARAIPPMQKKIEDEKWEAACKIARDFRYVEGFSEAEEMQKLLKQASDVGMKEFNELKAAVAADKKKWGSIKGKMISLQKDYLGTEVQDAIDEYFDLIRRKAEEKNKR